MTSQRKNNGSVEMDAEITVLGLGTRAMNCLKRIGVHRVGDLIQKTERELRSVRNCGRTTVQEIKRAMENVGLSLRDPKSPIMDPDSGRSESEAPEAALPIPPWVSHDRIHRMDALVEALGPLMYLIGRSAELARYFETGTLHQHTQSAHELWQGWWELLGEVERNIAPLARWLDQSVERPTERWTVGVLAEIQKIRWQIRSTDANPAHGPLLREFVQYLQHRQAEVKSILSSDAALHEEPARSRPMTKAELARRILGSSDTTIRARGISDARWAEYDLQKEHGARKYTIRLDRLDPAARDRVERP